MRRIALCCFALAILSGCGREHPENAASPVFFVVKAIKEKFQHSMGATYSPSYHEVEVTVVVGSRSRQPVRFDALTAVFHAAGKPMSAETMILTKDDTIEARYSLDGGTTPPPVEPQGVFELNYGEGTTFVLSSANSNFGLLAPGTERSVLVTLTRGGQTAYGPFTIGLPWPK